MPRFTPYNWPPPVHRKWTRYQWLEALVGEDAGAEHWRDWIVWEVLPRTGLFRVPPIIHPIPPRPPHPFPPPPFKRSYVDVVVGPVSPQPPGHRPAVPPTTETAPAGQPDPLPGQLRGDGDVVLVCTDPGAGTWQAVRRKLPRPMPVKFIRV